jgi:endo-1,4-beta-xylanase
MVVAFRRYPPPMAGRRLYAVAGLLMVLVAGPAAATSVAAPARHAATKHLKTRTPPPPRRVALGTAVRLDVLQRDQRYRDLVVSEFDSLTAENEMKMAFLQPRRGVFDFREADEIVAFAQRHHKAVRGHALVWGLQLPLWLIDHGLSDNLGLHLEPLALPPLRPPLDEVSIAINELLTSLTGWERNELLGIMRNHIETVMRHFGNDVPVWDVVNEPLDSNGSLQDNVWKRFVGDDYIELALRAARAANPDTKLFINEYAVEGPSAKLEGLVRLVRELKDRNVPLDGVGLQYHTNLRGPQDQATLETTMRRLAAMGVAVEITEMDVGTSLLDGSTAQRFERQAKVYGDAARACNAVEACTRLTTWGFTDRVSWLGPTELGLPFDAQYRPKPAYDALRAGLASPSARSSRRLRRVIRPARGGRVGVRKPSRSA